MTTADTALKSGNPGNSRSPLLSIWLHPSRTIREITHENPGYRLYVLPVLAGFAVLPTTVLFSASDSVIEYGILLGSLMAFGPAVEVLQLFVGAYLIRVTGTWLGGRADSASIKSAIAWGIAGVLITFAAVALGYKENLAWLFLAGTENLVTLIAK